MPFEIKLHPAEHIVEVVYPESPSPDEVGDYLSRMKELIDAQKGDWYCLVDQRSLFRLPAELLEQVAVANSYAVLHGMKRSARIVATPDAAEQANLISRKNGHIQAKVKAFTGRAEALAWLLSDAD